MEGRFFYNADGEMLIVPQHGASALVTELGMLEVAAAGDRCDSARRAFRVELPDGEARGYICENYGAHFRLPDLGPIGSNGLANPRDFLTPVAAFEDMDGDSNSSRSSRAGCGRRASTTRRSTSSRGTATTRRTSTICACFNTISTVSFDHPDPSIFTVLTSPAKRRASRTWIS